MLCVCVEQLFYSFFPEWSCTCEVFYHVFPAGVSSAPAQELPVSVRVVLFEVSVHVL